MMEADERREGDDVEEPRFSSFSSRTVTPEEAMALLLSKRGQCPIAHSDEFEGFHLLLGYGDVKRAMADWSTFSSSPSVLRPLSAREPFVPLDLDRPEHSAWRNLARIALNPKTPRLIEAAIQSDIDRYIDRFATAGHCELISALAEPIPLLALCRIFGIDGDRAERISELTRAMLHSIGTPGQDGALEAFAEFVQGELSERRANPREDGLTAVLRQEVDGEPVSDATVVRLMVSTLAAGHQSTTTAIGNTMDEILARPELQAQLQSEPELIPDAVEEVLRLRPPFYGFYRRATRDVLLHEEIIPEGGTVYMGWAAANRDPAEFENPDLFMLSRKPNRHLAFGHGVHLCMGSGIGRMLVGRVVGTVLDRLPDIRLAPNGRGNVVFAPTGDRAHLTRLEVQFTVPTRRAGHGPV